MPLILFNEECYVGVGFKHTYKTDNQILSLVSKGNGMIDWIVRKFIWREAKFILEISKTLLRPWIQDCAPVSKLGNYSIIFRWEGTKRRVAKMIKRVKDFSTRQRLEKLRLITLL